MKVGDLVLGLVVEAASGNDRCVKTRPLGLVVEVAPGPRGRVKWFEPPIAYWVSQKNLEVVSEGR